jgi:hypothetical protein
MQTRLESRWWTGRWSLAAAFMIAALTDAG